MGLEDIIKGAMAAEHLAKNIDWKTAATLKGLFNIENGFSMPGSGSVTRAWDDAAKHLESIKPGAVENIVKPKAYEKWSKQFTDINALNPADHPLKNYTVPDTLEEFLTSAPKELQGGFKYEYETALKDALAQHRGYATLKHQTPEHMLANLDDFISKSSPIYDSTQQANSLKKISEHLNAMQHMTPEQQEIYRIMIQDNPDISIEDAINIARNI